MRVVFPGLLLAVVLTALPARADIFRYVDQDGVEHYTNIQPSGRRWQRVLRTRGAAKAKRSSGPTGAAVLRAIGLTAPDPQRTTRYDAYIREAAILYVLPEEFLRAVMRVESNFYTEAVSSAGAMGLMQLMPQTARAMGVLDPFDPRQNVLGGARFLRVLANNLGGDLVLTIAAYNAGEGAVRKYGGIPPYAETRRYVQRVLTNYYAYRAVTQQNRALAER